MNKCIPKRLRWQHTIIKSGPVRIMLCLFVDQKLEHQHNPHTNIEVIMKLAVSQIFSSFDALQAAWFNHNQVVQKHYRILENKPTKCYKANCIHALRTHWKNVELVCQCHLYALPVRGEYHLLTGQWKVTSYHGIHMCSDSELHWKRNYKASVSIQANGECYSTPPCGMSLRQLHLGKESVSVSQSNGAALTYLVWSLCWPYCANLP
jgi:hypothetical protein